MRMCSLKMCSLQDEARQLLGSSDEGGSPEVALQWMIRHCRYAVVTLGSKVSRAHNNAISIVWHI